MAQEDNTRSTQNSLSASMASSQEFAGSQPNVKGDGDLTVREALKNKSVIDSNQPDIGGFGPTNKLLGKTPGERAFNLIDWYGIGYGLNSAISIWAGDQARQGIFWSASKKLNNFLGNQWIWRAKDRKDQKFNPLETEHLDRFVDELRKYAIAPENKSILDRLFSIQRNKILDPNAEGFNAETATQKLKEFDAKIAKLSDNLHDGDDLYRYVRRNTHLNDLFAAFDAPVETLHSSAPQQIDLFPLNQSSIEQVKPKTHMEAFVENHVSKYFNKEAIANNKTVFGRYSIGQLREMHPASVFDALAKDAQSLKTSRTNARIWTSFFMLSVGGWALMFPIKWLEDRKAGIVQYFDNRYERKHHLTEMQKDALHQRHEELKQEPQQTYASVLMARVISYPLIIASYLALGPKIKNFEQDGHESRSWLAHVPGLKRYKGTDHYADKAAEYVDEKLDTSPMYDKWKNRMQNSAVQRERGYRESDKNLKDRELLSRFSARDKDARAQGIIGDTITETVYSLWMVTCTFVASRFTAALFGKKTEPEKAPQSPLTPATPPVDSAPESNDALISQNAAPQPTTRISGRDALSTWMAKNQGTERVSTATPGEPARA